MSGVGTYLLSKYLLYTTIYILQLFSYWRQVSSRFYRNSGILYSSSSFTPFYKRRAVV